MSDNTAPKTLHLKALDAISQGEWHVAHETVQDETDRLSCLIHAYLHRLEGDMGNARYWYGRAGEQMPANTLAQELARLRKGKNDRG